MFGPHESNSLLVKSIKRQGKGIKLLFNMVKTINEY